MKAFPRLRRRSILMLLLVLVFVLALSGRTGSTTQVHAANTSIVHQSSAHLFALKGISSPNENVLQGVAVVSANDIWAVGDHATNSSGNYSLTLTEHWNGTKWSIVPSPSPGNGQNVLQGVAVVSANDVWAVGSYYNLGSNAHTMTLVEHWNGTSWNVVASPNLGTSNNSLQAVSVVSATDIWAVGSYFKPGPTYQTLTEHWNGTKWSIVPSPNLGNSENDLFGVSTVSATDVWAVGENHNRNGFAPTLIEHWNGTSWNVVPSPKRGGGLDNVAVVSATDVWAVGGAQFEHWNGTQWSIVASPNGTGFNSLSALTVVSANDIWAVGNYYNSNFLDQTLIEHWNGTSWNVVPSPNVGSNDNALTSVAEVSANDVWTVGFFGASLPTSQTLIEQWNGTKWSVVPSPNHK